MTLWHDIALHVRCKRIRRILQNYCDSELDDATTNRVAAHLEQCQRCGHEVSIYRAIKRSIKSGGNQINPQAVERLRNLAEQLATTGEYRGKDHES